MLFLARREVKNPRAVPPGRLASTRIQAHVYSMKLRREGKSLAAGWMVDRPVVYIMFQAASAAELHGFLAECPLAPYLRTVVTPLLSAEEGLEISTHLLDALNAGTAQTP